MMITVQQTWEQAFEDPFRSQLEGLLPAFLAAARWFGGKAKAIRSAKFSDIVRIGADDRGMILGFVDVSYATGEMETYVVPVTAAFDAEAERIKRDHASAVLGDLNIGTSQQPRLGVLYDALWNHDCAFKLLTSMGRSGRFEGSSGVVVGSSTVLFDQVALALNPSSTSVMKGEQSNTSVKFGEHVMMKLYRRSEPGMNPELEIGRVLTSRAFRNSPELVGALEYVRQNDEPITLALAQRYIANQGNAWDYTLSQLALYFDRIGERHQQNTLAPSATDHINSPSAFPDLFFDFLDAARLLGRRTGELHNVLGQPSDDPAFSPEPCSTAYVQDRIQSMQDSVTQAMALLRGRLSTLSKSDRDKSNSVLQLEPAILERMESLNRESLTAMRIRCHGDYHLGQVLYTGQDFIIIDYEGEPARPLAERRGKHLPIVDLSGMIRSFHYAAHAALRHRSQLSTESQAPRLTSSAEQWYRSVRETFLEGYRAVAGEATFAPRSQQEFNRLLDLHLLDKAVYELTYELNNRPDWVALPLTGILQCVDSSDAGDQDERTEPSAGACDPVRSSGRKMR